MERTKKLPKLIVLVNDPSICAWGWAVIAHGQRIIDSGCIKTTSETKKRRIRKGDDSVRRISEINETLLSIIRKYKVNYILSELPHGSQSASAAVMIGVVRGILQTMADCLSIGIEWYSEADAKRSVLGKNSASKDEMIGAISSIYPQVPWVKTKYIDEAVADAMAVYHAATKQSSVLKMFNQL